MMLSRAVASLVTSPSVRVSCANMQSPLSAMAPAPAPAPNDPQVDLRMDFPSPSPQLPQDESNEPGILRVSFSPLLEKSRELLRLRGSFSDIKGVFCGEQKDFEGGYLTTP